MPEVLLPRPQEWEYAKMRQDAQLDRIEKGVGTLGEMAKGMQEELDKQNPVIDDIDTQLNKVTSQLKSNNAKLKGLVTQVSRGWGGVCGAQGACMVALSLSCNSDTDAHAAVSLLARCLPDVLQAQLLH